MPLLRWLRQMLMLFLIYRSPVTESQSIHEGIQRSRLQDDDKSVNSEPRSKSDVSSLVRNFYQTYMHDCHLLFIINGEESHLFNSILRSLRHALISLVILDLKTTLYDLDNDMLQDLRKGEEKVTCRVFLFDLTNVHDFSFVSQFMKNIELFLIRHTHVLFVGNKALMPETLQSSGLWNTVYAFYIVVPHLGKESVTIYTRCLFCKQGDAGIEIIGKWNPAFGFLWEKDLFEDQFKDMEGHKVRGVNLEWYPFMDFTRDSDEPSTTVTPLDSVEIRMLDAISNALNFTYEIRIPWDEQWGTITDSGNWTGLVGTLQHHKADFGMTLVNLRGRLKVADFTRTYTTNTLIMVMSKPSPQPPFFALIRPLTGSLWAALLVSSFSAGIILWLLQWGWSKISGKPGWTFDLALLYTWSVLFEEPAASLPRNTSSLMFLGWWWIYCTLISVTYKSSLIAHLSVPGKSNTIDSFEELLQEDGWTWGFEATHFGSYQWLRTNDNPVIKEIFKSLEIQPIPGQMERVLTTKHILIVDKFRIMSIVASSYTDNFGYTPAYYGKTEYLKYGQGAAFRKNAPFKRAIDMMIQRLTESGIIAVWINDLVGTPKEGQEEGIDQEEQEKELDKIFAQEDSGNVVLGMLHLQTVFYVLFLGLHGALIAFLGENLIKIIGPK